jgi:uncharacterized membrane protein YbhN (UPF0104 family)
MIEGLAILADGATTYILLAIIVYFGSALLYALREYIAIQGFGKRARYLEILKAYLGGLFVNNITPMARAGGEALRIVWLNKTDKVPKSVVTAAVVYERAIEGLAITLVALFAITKYSARTSLVAAVVLAFILSVVLVFRSDLLLEFVERVSKEKLDARTKKLLIKKLRFGPTTLTMFIISLVIWVLDMLRFILEVLAVGKTLDWAGAALLSISNVFLGILGITPGGVGIVEGGLVGVLAGMGFSLADAAKVVAIERSISLILSSLVGFVVITAFGGREAWKALKSRWHRTGSSPE